MKRSRIYHICAVGMFMKSVFGVLFVRVVEL
jgi:hypothetical protein